MKSPAILLTLMAGVGIALGQGTIISFRNDITGGGDHRVYCNPLDNHLSAGLTGTNYVAELWYVDPATTALTPWAASISRFRVSSTSAPGTWSGKTVTLPFGGIGTSVQVEVYIWDAVLNPTGDMVGGAGLKGSSGLFTYTWHNSLPNPPDPSDTEMVNMPAFAVCIPEPSVLAFGVLGVVSLLLFRRRN